ncbi:F510_1955 family glycosylhydrolase [Pseudobacillus badius]|uniref:F510_1955 family glycosylhydrolase n=1 Tax=Bacillus badius TaxID=1455 RepID=UPI003D34957C
MKKHKKILVSGIAALFLLGACSNGEKEEYFVKAKGEKVEHIHGAGYLGEEKTPVIATHDGLLKYENKSWYKATENNHDYMGFQTFKDGFYASGHPQQGADLKNPLGLIKSTDEGKSIDKLAFYGETDFHYLGASYEVGTIYAVNEMPNSKIGAGVYYTKNEGKDWTQAALNGVTSSSLGGLDVHPSKDNLIALYAKEGIFLSENYGKDFTLIKTKGIVTSLTFKKGAIVYSTLEENKPVLHEINLDDKKEVSLNNPSLTAENPPIYLEVNPEKETEMMFVTAKNDVYVTKDQKEGWNKILSNGETE